MINIAIVGELVKIFLAFILFFNSYAYSAETLPGKTVHTDQLNYKKQLVLQILKNENGTLLKQVLKEILPKEDHVYIEANVPDKLQINFKTSNDTIILNNKTRIKLTDNSTIILNGVRVAYNTAQSFESNVKNIHEKSHRFGLIYLFLPQNAHAILPGLIVGKIAIDVLVPAVILGLTSALAISYGALSWKFFNFSLVDNAEIICDSKGQLYYNKPHSDLGVDLPEVILVQTSLSEYKKQFPSEKKCTDDSAKEAQKHIRALASASLAKSKYGSIQNDSANRPKDTPAQKQRAETTQ